MIKIVTISMICFMAAINLQATDKDYVYIVHDAKITPYQIVGPTLGALSRGADVSNSNPIDDFVIDPLGRFLYEVSSAALTITIYSIDDAG